MMSQLIMSFRLAQNPREKNALLGHNWNITWWCGNGTFTIDRIRNTDRMYESLLFWY